MDTKAKNKKHKPIRPSDCNFPGKLGEFFGKFKLLCGQPGDTSMGRFPGSPIWNDLTQFQEQ